MWQRDQVPSRERHGGAILEEDVGLCRGDELADAHRCGGQLCAHLIGNTGVDEQCIHAREQSLGAVAIPRGDQCRVGRMHRDPRPGGFAQAPGQSVVVRMDVRDQDRLHVCWCVSSQSPCRPRARSTPPRCSSRCRSLPPRSPIPGGTRARNEGGCSGAVPGSTRALAGRARRPATPPHSRTLAVPSRSPRSRSSDRLSRRRRWDWPRDGPGRRRPCRPSARRGSSGILPRARAGDSRRCSAQQRGLLPRG